jgi:predicted HAD superfamily Cof-like phosphohydrolase
MKNFQAQVTAFMRMAGQHIAHRPRRLPLETAATRSNWLLEEALEAQKAAIAGDTPQLAKELCDVLYVVFGTANSAGIDLSPVWEAVHDTNMGKKGGATGPDGKLHKPEGWKAPNVVGILKSQGWEG